MKKQSKLVDSKIITDNLTYTTDSQKDKIREYLLEEQRNLCAYTETYLGRSDQKDIEHFNPTLKGTPTDCYDNWFLVKSQWNKEKSSKWSKYQPILYPTDPTFEKRIIYKNFGFICRPSDIEAKNLIALLNLDDLELADQRKKYIQRRKKEINRNKVSPRDFFVDLYNDEPHNVYFIRALEAEFNIVFDFL